jgi:hypothetical protein
MSENEMTGNIFYFAASKTKVAAISPAPQTDKLEARLVERICAGNIEAFGEFYKMFAPLVHGIVLARVPRDEVDDVGPVKTDTINRLSNREENSKNPIKKKNRFLASAL